MGVTKYLARINEKTIMTLKDGLRSHDEFNIKEYSETIDLDKSWDMIHYLVTGQKSFFGNHEFTMLYAPLNSTIAIPDEELDFYWDNAGVPDEEIQTKWNEIDKRVTTNLSFLKKTEILQILFCLGKVNLRESWNELDFNKLNQEDIYPGVWTRSNEDFEYVMFYYTKLREFLKSAVEEDECVVLL